MCIIRHVTLSEAAYLSTLHHSDDCCFFGMKRIPFTPLVHEYLSTVIMNRRGGAREAAEGGGGACHHG